MGDHIKRQKLKLSADLQFWRAERPDEWTMDEFIRKAINLESINSDFLDAAKIFQEYERACDDGDDVAMMLKYGEFANRINAAIVKAKEGE